MVKQMDRQLYYKKNNTKKQDILTDDILEIIMNRVEYCELTEFPYSLNSNVHNAAKQAMHIVKCKFHDITGVWLSDNEVPFAMHRIVDEDGTPHVYCRFNIVLWDRLIEQKRKEKRNAV